MLRKLFLVIICLAFAALLALITFTQGEEVSKQVVAIPENHLLMENMHLIHVMDDGSSYVTLSAETAYFDNNTETATLENTGIKIIDNVNEFTSRADHGIYELNKSISTSGDIHGIWNDLTYSISPDGTFVFDLVEDRAVARGDIVLIKQNNDIRVKELIYNGKSKRVDFRGGVEMIISGETLK